jgi:hypothetical protein
MRAGFVKQNFEKSKELKSDQKNLKTCSGA